MESKNDQKPFVILDNALNAVGTCRIMAWTRLVLRTTLREEPAKISTSNVDPTPLSTASTTVSGGVGSSYATANGGLRPVKTTRKLAILVVNSTHWRAEPKNTLRRPANPGGSISNDNC